MNGFNLNLISKYRAELMGISILWIWFLHMSFKFPFPVSTVQSMGATGVDIFFFVSAVGLYYSLSKNENVLQFYKRRLIKIIPTYLIIGIPYRIYEYFATEQLFDLHSFFSFILKKLFFVDFWIKGNASLWYIPAILICYLCYPLLYKIFNTEKSFVFRVTFLTLCSIFMVILNYLLVYYGCTRPTDMWILRIPIFVLGCFIAPYVKNESKIKINNAVWFILFLFVYLIYNFLNIKTGLLFYGNVKWSCLLLSVMAIFVIILVPTVFEKIKFFKLKKFLSKIGEYTLDIYILNEATLCFARNQTESKFLIDVISVIFTTLAMSLIILLKKRNLQKGKSKSFYGNK